MTEMTSNGAPDALQSRPDPDSLLFVGTHRRAHRSDAEDTAFGIYVFAGKDSALDSLHATGLAETEQPGWLSIHPTGKWLYAVNEVRRFQGDEGGAVSAFVIDRSDCSLRPLNTKRLPAMPCHCTVDPAGKLLLVATFGGGSVHLFELNEDGSIGRELDAHFHSGSSQHPQRQTHPHAHAVVLTPDGRFVLVPDLGIDQVLVYELDRERGRLIPRPESGVRLAPMSGPRHIAFSPSGEHAYLINEMSATITALRYEPSTGSLTPIQAIDLLPDGFTGLRSGAAICLHPDGRHLYATTRSHGSSGMPENPGLDTLAWFLIDPLEGILTFGGRLPSGGSIPRSMTMSAQADRLFVAHQCSGSIAEFMLPVPVPTDRVLQTPVPVCLILA
jgi:6-phosphogluconolactonase